MARLDARMHFVLLLSLWAGCAKPSAIAVHEDAGMNQPPEDLAGADLSGDLAVAGDLAHMVGMCPAGQKACNGGCINAVSCCGSDDCPQYANSIATCTPAGMCTYMCASGFVDCNGTCRSSSLCCKDADCPPMPNSMTPHCSTSGMCTVGACDPGWVDFNKNPADGCECQDGGKAAMCAMATPLGSIALTTSQSVTGNILTMNGDNWMSVTFPGNTDARYHPHIRFTANPSGQFVFDVVRDCNAATQACGTEAGKTANGVSEWEVLKTGGDVGAIMYAAVPAVGTAGTVKIRVYRAVSGAPTCDNYTLAISN